MSRKKLGLQNNKISAIPVITTRYHCALVIIFNPSLLSF